MVFPFGFCLLSSLKFFYYLFYCYLALFKTFFFFFTIKCTSNKVNSFNYLQRHIYLTAVYFSGINYLHIVVQSPPSTPRTFSSFQTKTPCPLTVTPHLPPSYLLATTFLFCPSMNLTT